jgi:diguanylate cyclase (GGDEF)-like protein
MGTEQEYKYLKGWVKHLSTIDPPTGLLNRHGWVTFAAKHLQRSARSGQRVGVLLIEVDGLSCVIDEHGHEAGDQAVQQIAEALEAELRPGDLLGRWIEDMFILFLPGQDANHLPGIAERLRKAVETKPLTLRTGAVRLSVTIGGATLTSQTGDLRELESVISHADGRLGQAKAQGPNQVVV